MTPKAKYIKIALKCLNATVTLLALSAVSPIATTAQKIFPTKPAGELLLGNGGDDVVNDIGENNLGRVVGVGTSSRGPNGGADIFFFPISKKFEKETIVKIGRSGDDGAISINQGYDGNWLVAGYSTTPSKSAKDARLIDTKKYQGKKDGWFIILDDNGKVLRDFNRGTKEDDVFTNVFPLIDGGFIITGNAGTSAWVIRLDKKLQIKWEKLLKYHDLPAQIRSAVCTYDEKIFYVGTLEELGEKKMWVGGIATDGEKIFDKIFPISQATEGTGIIELGEKMLGICGAHNHRKDRENGFFCTIDRSGNLGKYVSVGGSEADVLNDLTLLENGNVALVGTSKSFVRGARRSSAWTIMLDKKRDYFLDKKDNEQYYGTKLSEEAISMMQRSDGAVLAAGFSSRKIFKKEEAWVFQLNNGKRNRDKKKPKVKVSLNSVVYPDSLALAPSERAFQTFSIENNGDEGIVGTKIRIETDKKAYEYQVGILAPQSKRIIGLPIDYDIVGKDGNLAIGVFNDEDVLLPSQKIAVNLTQKRKPRLVVESSQVVLEAGKQTDLEFVVRNEGDGVAESVQVFLNASAQLKLPPQYALENLKPNETRRFKVSAEAVGAGAASLSVRIADANFSTKDSLNLLYPISQSEKKVSVANTQPQVKPNQTFINAFWIAPNPDQFDRKEIVWDEPEITVQVKAVSSGDITKQGFIVEVNGQSSATGAKFDEVSMRGKGNSLTFQQVVRLKEGLNTIKATIKNETGQAQTEYLRIVYSPRKPNLHILAIGVPQPDLKYTTKDGRDFVRALTNQAGKTYQAVFADTLFEEKNTTKTEILKSMKRLQYRFNDRQITSNDVLIVFISSHGLSKADGDFRIAAGDYDGPYMQETSLSFEKEIVNYLNNIGCTKMFFLDACHSGESELQNDANYDAGKNAINMLVSCRANEFSYEDDRWQNGAFTKTLIQAFEEFKVNKSLDPNNDNALDVQELYRFVEKQVPLLVSQKKPKPTTEQHPVLITQENNKPLVLFSK